ncbi:MAG: hypothetical protein AMJ46_09510 [Latescibacteria bacterium DG_63]|nr:MAG: hypothetical protein AMJ46_09510 [Latescibacteria bacterium DG_63]
MLSANGMNGRRKIRSLIETWVRFGEFLKTSLGREGVQKAQEEEFLRLKARIAHLLPILTVIERSGSIDPEALAAVRDITEMLNSFATLATPEPLTVEETEEIIARWHTIFIFLNKLEGAVKDRRYGFVRRGGERAQETGFTRVARSRLTRFFISLVIVVACVTIVAGLLDISMEEAREAFGKGIAIILGQEGVSTGEKALSEAADSTAIGGSDTLASVRAGKSEKTPSVKSVVARTIGTEEQSVLPAALRPLARQYGRHLTMIIFAAFLAGIVFLFFLRVK